MQVVSASTELSRAYPRRVNALRVYPASQDRGSSADILYDLVHTLKNAKQVKAMKDPRFPRLYPIFILERTTGRQTVFFLSLKRLNRSWTAGNERAEDLVTEAADLLMSKGVELPANAKTICPVSFITFAPNAKESPIENNLLKKAGFAKSYQVICDVPPTGAGAMLLGGWLVRFVETGATLTAASISNFAVKVWQKAATELNVPLLHLESAKKPMEIIGAPTRTSLVVLMGSSGEVNPKYVVDKRIDNGTGTIDNKMIRRMRRGDAVASAVPVVNSRAVTAGADAEEIKARMKKVLETAINSVDEGDFKEDVQALLKMAESQLKKGKPLLDVAEMVLKNTKSGLTVKSDKEKAAQKKLVSQMETVRVFAEDVDVEPGKKQKEYFGTSAPEWRG